MRSCIKKFEIVSLALLAGMICTETRGQESAEQAEIGVQIAGELLAPASQSLSFQGVLTDNLGAPLPGTLVDLSFTLWDAVANVALQGPIVMNNVELRDGIVDVAIPVEADGFDGRALSLGLRVNGGPEMAPRISLTTVPYAFRVNRVSSEELDDAIQLGGSGDQGSLSLVEDDGTESVVIDGQDDTLTGGAIKVRTSSGSDAVSIHGETRQLAVSGRDGQLAVIVSGSLISGSGRVKVYGNDGLTNTGVLEGRSTFGASTGGRLALSTSTGSMRAQLEGGRSNAGFLTLRDGITSTVQIDAGGDAVGALVRLTTPAGGESALLQGTETGVDGGQLAMRQANSTWTVILDAEESGGGGVLDLRNSNGTTTVEVDADEGDDGVLRVSDTTGNTRLEMLSDFGSTTHGSAMQLYNDANERTILIDGDEGSFNAPAIRMYANNGTSLVPSVIIDSDSGSPSSGAAIFLYNDSGDLTVEIDADESDNASAIRLYDSTGAQTIVLDPSYSGNGRVITGVLQLTGGSDLSEQFDISSPSGATEPGMVVSIDANNPGKLVVSDKAYDRAVAGVISGAGGVNTGFLMGQTGSIADGATPVALTGRVWTQCDASHGPITPGTLLTTSPRLGHAMAASNYDQARGAIIGKAMTALTDGTGLVLVLIQPQ